MYRVFLDVLAETSDRFRVYHDLLEKVMLSLQYHGTYCNYKQPGWKKCSCKLEISVNCHKCNVMISCVGRWRKKQSHLFSGLIKGS